MSSRSGVGAFENIVGLAKCAQAYQFFFIAQSHSAPKYYDSALSGQPYAPTSLIKIPASLPAAQAAV